MNRGQSLSRVLAPYLLAVVVFLACSDADVDETPTEGPRISQTGNPAATETRQPGPSGTLSASGPTPTLIPPVSEPFPSDLLVEAGVILADLEEVRGLPVLTEIGMNLISRGAASDFYRANITSAERERFRVQSNVFALLGMVPEDTSVLDTLLGLLGLGIAGFYSSDLEAFYLVDDLGGLNSQASRQTIVHELVHALQDQHYDLQSLGEQRETNWDASAALLSVIEGDAVATEAAYYGGSLRPRPACFSLPPYSQLLIPYAVVRELNSPYDDGLCFVEFISNQLGANPAVIFRDPPISTEQILHPETYLAGEVPLEVSLEPLQPVLAEGYQLIESSTLGEFGLQNLLIPGLRSQTGLVQEAAAGWGGDSWAFFENGSGGRFLHLVVAWDTQKDAQEFWDALAESLSNRTEAPFSEPGREAFRVQLGSNFWLALFAPGTVTLLVSNDEEALMDVSDHFNVP